ncbi:hypothetical protein WA026_009794 [Henosepilachna vigintioctopunctata]|uniref:Potassium channel domain-containing protein n=1 Tax=Henosepilachna vigintioctopunctata TaxID=420089 RepID=A0AAW1TST7_9CUCU
MMSTKTFLIVLLIFCVYVSIGAMVFYSIESAEEKRRIEIEIEKRKRVRDIVNKIHPSINDKKEYFDVIEDYCGKSIKNIPMDVERKWDFYHCIFFVITVVSTIGYGNLAPTTMLSRMFMIFYALVGIPINGYIMIALGDFFGKSFTKLYNRWKDTKKLRQVDPSRLGLVAQIVLYLVPGFTFFIFVPSILISEFENWSYDEAVYYSFVTLTTIGFGDYVAGNQQGDLNYVHYTMYQIFLIVWVIGGLGYVVMILNFIARGMRSKKLQEFEHRIASNIMKTPTKIRQELRTILEEFLMVRVKKVYKEFDYEPHRIERSQSCPDLMICHVPNLPPHIDRKRAFSESQNNYILQRIQSDTDLERIDKELTFRGKNEQADLIIKVFDALSIDEHTDPEPGCYDGFSEREILASEAYNSQWSLASNQLTKAKPAFRSRAFSDVRYPTHITRNENEHTWYGQSNLANYAKLIRDDKSNSEPMNDIPKEPISLFKRIKNNLLTKQDRNNDVEKGKEPFKQLQVHTDNKIKRASTSNQQEEILEHTSVADLIRALTTLSEPLPSGSQQEGQYQDMLSNSRTRRMPIISNFQNRKTSLVTNPSVPNPYKSGRRCSLVPPTDLPNFSIPKSGSYRSRRFSLAPVSEPPPPYSQVEQRSNPYPLSPSKIRRFSVRPVSSLSSPPQKFSKRDTEDS